jgi:hypothetical protein
MENLDTVAPRVRAEIAEFCSQFAIPGIRER